MSESLFFRWIEIERFRGFSDRQRLLLDASAIILTGPNGTGKTSFFDAVQWLLLGTIERLEPWRARKNTEHIINRYCVESGEPAVVAAAVQIGEREIELRRSGRYDASQLEWREGGETLYEREAEAALAGYLAPAETMSLERSLLSSGLLQQDVIRDVLEDKPRDRYDQLASILGLDSIVDFPRAAKRRADRLARDADGARDRVAHLEGELRTNEERLVSARTRLAAQPDVKAVRRTVEERLRPHDAALRLRVEVPLAPAEARNLRTAAGTGAESVDRLLRELPELSDLSQEAIPDAEFIIDLRRRLAEASAASAAAGARVDEARTKYEHEKALSDRFSVLAADAMPLLGPRCPVCQQDINSEEIHQHLEHLVAKGSADLERRREELDVATGELADASDRERRDQDVLRSGEDRMAEQERATQRSAEWRMRLGGALRELSKDFECRRERDLEGGDIGALNDLRRALEDVAASVGELLSALTWAHGAEPIATLEGTVADLEEAITEAKVRATKASVNEESAKLLERAAVRATTAVTSQRFEFYRPVIQDVYRRLDPHPTFTDLRFEVGVYRERGVASPQVFDPEQRIDADPLLVFSSSQANVVALSAFLALGWAAGDDAMPFLLLDDPLQALDDVNALGFADLCRHLRSDRQLIVSTHDPRLAGLLERKLAPRRANEKTRLLRFIAWSRRGPIIDPAEVTPQVDQGSRRALVTEQP